MQLIHTIKQLMYDKYGEDRFALACEIVARWVQFETKDKRFDAVWICQMANANEYSAFEVPYEVEVALCRLFGLKNSDELFIK